MSARRVWHAPRPLRLAVDIGLALGFAALFATSIVDDFPHEWLGMAMFALFIAHLVFNRGWVGRLRRGRMTVARALGAVVDVALIACMVALMASSIVLSTHVFSWLPVVPGASWARMAHLLGSYWGIVLVGVHAGMHVRAMAGKLASRPHTIWVARVAFLACLALGGWSFFQLGFPDYLFLRSQFVFVDPSASFAWKLVQYLAIEGAVAGLTHYVLLAARRLAGGVRNNKDERSS